MSQMIQRQTMDEYLDGMLEAKAARELEAAVAADPVAARRLAVMKSERALRAAAYDSYAPTRQEASRYAAQLMAAAHEPVGFVGKWFDVRRVAGVAAAIAVLIGTFAMGRMSGSATVANGEDAPKTMYRVVYYDSGMIQRVSEDMASLDEVSEYIRVLNQNGMNYASVDSISPDGQL